jgi:hypothetical protein
VRGPLWASASEGAWRAALERYDDVIATQSVASLAAHERWYRAELPVTVLARSPPRLTLEELVGVTRWKMARGVWRARNLALVEANPPGRVEEASGRALAAIPDPRRPIAELAVLRGVGPATASAVAAAVAPEVYPFLDEIVAAQVPGLGPVAFTPAYYARYAGALRRRAAALGGGWSPADVERALWSAAGGKAGATG